MAIRVPEEARLVAFFPCEGMLSAVRLKLPGLLPHMAKGDCNCELSSRHRDMWMLCDATSYQAVLLLQFFHLLTLLFKANLAEFV
jgi:hypothetical protein